MREPAIAWWPGKIKPGKTTEVWLASQLKSFNLPPDLSFSLSLSHSFSLHLSLSLNSQLAATIDLFPTIAQLTGAAMPNNVTIDGIDMSPFLFGNGTVYSLPARGDC